MENPFYKGKAFALSGSTHRKFHFAPLKSNIWTVNLVPVTGAGNL
jgi:hypothetical protein